MSNVEQDKHYEQTWLSYYSKDWFENKKSLADVTANISKSMLSDLI